LEEKTKPPLPPTLQESPSAAEEQDDLLLQSSLKRGKCDTQYGEEQADFLPKGIVDCQYDNNNNNL
jgi:hypothetical protein